MFLHVVPGGNGSFIPRRAAEGCEAAAASQTARLRFAAPLHRLTKAPRPTPTATRVRRELLGAMRRSDSASCTLTCAAWGDRLGSVHAGDKPTGGRRALPSNVTCLAYAGAAARLKPQVSLPFTRLRNRLPVCTRHGILNL